MDNPYNPLDYEGKAGHGSTISKSLHRINNCLGVCHMNTIHWDIEQIDLPQLAELDLARHGMADNPWKT